METAVRTKPAEYTNLYHINYSTMSAAERKELLDLKQELTSLKKQLSRSQEMTVRLTESEKLLKDRLSEQAQQHLEAGTIKFEDLSLGENRPTILVERYGNLYTQTRVDAFDALDELPEMQDFDDLKGKLLFSVMVLAFRCCQQAYSDLRFRLRHLLYMDERNGNRSNASKVLAKQLENHLSLYLRKSVEDYDVGHIIEEVSDQVWMTLYDYPCLKTCDGFKLYIDETVRLAWAFAVQNPPLVLEYDAKTFDSSLHERFHASNSDSATVRSVLWPALLEGEGGPCIYKGVVIT